MGDTSETNTKVLSPRIVFRCGSTKTPIQKNHYLRDKVPFPKSGHILVIVYSSAIDQFKYSHFVCLPVYHIH